MRKSYWGILLVVLLVVAGVGVWCYGQQVPRVAFVVQGDLEREPFYQLLKEGLLAEGEADQIESTVFNALGSADSLEKWLVDASDGMYDLVVVCGGDFAEAAEVIVPAHPKQKYVTVDFAMSQTLPNVYGMTARGEEGAFLAGALAAQASTHQMIGFVGGQDVPSVRHQQQGYVQGAQLMVPDIVIISDYVGDCRDLARAEQLAMHQYMGGADVIYQVAGAAGEGVVRAALAQGRLVIGSEVDQGTRLAEAGREAEAACVLTSVENHWDARLRQALARELGGDGLPFGTTDSQGLAEGVIGLADNRYYEENVSEYTREKLLTLQEQIKSGAIVVTTK